MSLSLADVDVRRLSPRARKTLEEIAAPLAEGATEAELAEKLRTTRRRIAERREELAFEMEAQVRGAQIREATDDENQALLDSIRELGQLVPGIVNASGAIVAGNRRKWACDQLGVPFRSVTLAELGIVDEHDVAIAENLVRRHLSPQDRRRMVEAELIRKPDRSDRSIASTLGVSPTTVGTVRKELEARGEVSNLDTRVGKDGKTQSSRARTGGDRDAGEAGGDDGPTDRLGYVAEELRSLAALEDRDHARARGHELVDETLRALGRPEIADAYKELIWR